MPDFAVQLDPTVDRALLGFEDGLQLAVEERDELYTRTPAELLAAADILERDYARVPIVLGYARALRIVAAEINDGGA